MNNLLIVIDMQYDFIEGGSLAVTGGLEACKYMADWIDKNGSNITKILTSRDDHYLTHIGLPKAWNENPEPFTTITQKDVVDGKYTPKNLDPDYVKSYLGFIESHGYSHTIWPEHCIHGTYGQLIEKSLVESMNNWAEKYNSHWITIDKGSKDWVEHYSVFSQADEFKQMDEDLLDTISGFDKIYIAGIAKDVCVYHTLNDLIINGENRFDNKIVLLENGIVGINPNDERSNEFYRDLIENHGAQVEK